MRHSLNCKEKNLTMHFISKYKKNTFFNPNGKWSIRVCVRSDIFYFNQSCFFFLLFLKTFFYLKGQYHAQSTFFLVLHHVKMVFPHKQNIPEVLPWFINFCLINHLISHGNYSPVQNIWLDYHLPGTAPPQTCSFQAFELLSLGASLPCSSSTQLCPTHQQ